MKLMRVGEAGEETPAIYLDDGTIRDLTGVVPDIAGDVLLPDTMKVLAGYDFTRCPVVDAEIRVGPCVGNIGKFICIGLNYEDHARETNAPIPEEPVVFSKWTSAINGPNDAIIKPLGSKKLDWEVELGIVIGKPARYVTEAEASSHIAGFCVINDVSERDFQLERGGQWDKGKGCDTFGPIGPWLVTPDEVDNVEALHLWLEVNGERYQDGSTSLMIFKPQEIISYLSKFMSLQPGDVISTGTPPGVGLGLNPPRYLDVGDEVRLGIDGLGQQRQRVVPCPVMS